MKNLTYKAKSLQTMFLKCPFHNKFFRKVNKLKPFS